MAEVSGSGDAERPSSGRGQRKKNRKTAAGRRWQGRNTHNSTCSPSSTFYLMTGTDIYIYRFPEQQTVRRAVQKFWITRQASHQHLYRTSYIYDKEHQGQRNHSRMRNTLASLCAQSKLHNTHSQTQTGALRSPKLLLVLLLNPATDCQWKLIWSHSNDTALQKEWWMWGGGGGGGIH